MIRFAFVLAMIACTTAAKPATPKSSTVVAEIKLAEDAERARKHDLAKEYYLAAIAAARSNEEVNLAHREYARTLISWGELEIAARELQAAVVAKPEDAGSWHDLGLVAHTLGDVPTAIKSLERARDLRPTDPRPRIALAAMRWKHGDRAGATLEYKSLLALDLPEKVREKVEWALSVLAKADGNAPVEP